MTARQPFPAKDQADRQQRTLQEGYGRQILPELIAGDTMCFFLKEVYKRRIREEYFS